MKRLTGAALASTHQQHRQKPGYFPKIAFQSYHQVDSNADSEVQHLFFPSQEEGSWGLYLDGILAACAGPAINEGVAHVDNPADPVRIGVQFCFEGLVLLMLALKTPNTPPTTTFQNQVLRGSVFRDKGFSEGSGSELRELGAGVNTFLEGSHRICEKCFWSQSGGSSEMV